MEETAKVVSANGDYITVESEVKSSCSSCQQVNDCGSGQVAKAIPHRKLTVECKNDLDVKVGETVVLAIPEEKLLISAWQVYFLPLIGLILFTGLMQFISSFFQLEHEIFTIVVGLIGGYLGFRLAIRLQSDLTIQQNLMPKLLRKQPETINIVEINT